MWNQSLKLKLLVSNALVVILSLLARNAIAQNMPAFPDNLSSAATAQSKEYDPTWLRITAFTNVPLSGATVRVYDKYGRVLYEQRRATNTQGVFAALIKKLPKDFRVTVVWNGEQDQDEDRDEIEDPGNSFPQKIKLSADVQNFDPARGIVFVNPATTIVSRLLDRYPELDLKQAQILVRRLLGMPLNASLGAALREGRQFHSKYFSATAFMAEASHAGGVNLLINALTRQAHARSLKTHRFAPTSSLGGVATFIARNLVSGALSWAGGQGAGWVAQSAGLTTPGATAAAVANLQAGLNDLQSSVDELSKQLTALQEEITAELTATQYTVIATPALALASSVDAVENVLTFYALDCPALVDGVPPPNPPSQYCANQRQTIGILLNDAGINTSFETLSTYLLDKQVVGFKGMLHLFSVSVGQSVRFFRPADSTKIQNMFDYWDAEETQAANLKVELAHLNGAPGPNGEGKQSLIAFLGDSTLDPPTQGTFQNTHDSEAKLVYPAVPLGTVINTKDLTMWATAFPDVSSCLFPDDNAKVPPPRVWDYAPQTSEVTWNSINGWTSPTQTQTQTLISGWVGANPITWLIAESQAVDPDSPTSPGFPLVPNNPGFGPQFACPVGTVWTKTTSGTNSYYLFNVYSAGSTSGPVGHSNGFVFLARNLAAGEQYYWYQ